MNKKRAMQLKNDYIALREDSFKYDKKKKSEREAAELKAQKDEEVIQELKDKKKSTKMKLQKFKKDVKDKLVSETFNRIFDKCLGDCMFGDNMKGLSNSLVANYIEEAGADNILMNMHTKSLLLSELAACIEESYDAIMEDVDPDDDTTFEVDDSEMDNFYDKLDMNSFDDVSNLIKTRVNNAAGAFVQSNINDKIDITDSMRDTQEKIANIKQGVRQSDEDIEQMKESYMTINRRKASKIAERPKSLYEQMVYTLTESIVKNDNLRSRFSVDNKLNMDLITEDVNTMYTFLEMLNTLKIERIDESYIEAVLKDMAN